MELSSDLSTVNMDSLIISPPSSLGKSANARPSISHRGPSSADMKTPLSLISMGSDMDDGMVWDIPDSDQVFTGNSGQYVSFLSTREQARRVNEQNEYLEREQEARSQSIRIAKELAITEQNRRITEKAKQTTTLPQQLGLVEDVTLSEARQKLLPPKEQKKKRSITEVNGSIGKKTLAQGKKRLTSIFNSKKNISERARREDLNVQYSLLEGFLNLTDTRRLRPKKLTVLTNTVALVRSLNTEIAALRMENETLKAWKAQMLSVNPHLSSTVGPPLVVHHINSNSNDNDHNGGSQQPVDNTEAFSPVDSYLFSNNL